jgi:hypothetical protein
MSDSIYINNENSENDKFTRDEIMDLIDNNENMSYVTEMKQQVPMTNEFMSIPGEFLVYIRDGREFYFDFTKLYLKTTVGDNVTDTIEAAKQIAEELGGYVEDENGDKLT